MAGHISGGPSRTHRLGNQAEIEAAEAALQARSVQGVRRPLPPPAPLPEDMLPDVEQVVVDPRLGMPLPAAAPTDEPAPPLEGTYTAYFGEADVQVTLWAGKRAYTGSGGSLTEALGIAAGELEEGLAQPVCPHCGQVLPESE